MKKGYEDGYGMSKSNAKGKNEQYMSGGMNLKDGTQASAPKKVSIPMGQGFSEVTPFRGGNLGYPKQAFDYKY